jgi:folate-dependent phosphoribosylglycinamide formyltransferase PurN
LAATARDMAISLAEAENCIQLQLHCLGEAKGEDLRKESRIKALMDENKDMKRVLDAQQQEIEAVQAAAKRCKCDNMEKEICIKALMVEKEKCNKELMFEKKMTAELDVLRERIVLMQGHNDAMVASLGEAETRLVDSKKTILMKEQSIKALMDEMKVMKSVVDAQQKEIEMVLAMSQQVNMEKEKCLKELMFEKKLTAELDDLRPRMVSMQGHNNFLVESLAEAKLDNTEKEKRIRELTFELNTLRGNAKLTVMDEQGKNTGDEGLDFDLILQVEGIDLVHLKLHEVCMCIVAFQVT